MRKTRNQQWTQQQRQTPHIELDQRKPRQRIPRMEKCRLPKTPHDFEQCTVTITFTLPPADGDTRGRRVVISYRNHLDAPIFTEGEWRLADMIG